MSKQTAITFDEFIVWSLITIWIFVHVRAIYIEFKK
jgi:hypothetical protein